MTGSLGAADVRKLGEAARIEPLDPRSAYAEIFATHHAEVFRLATLLCGDRHRAEDATAEAFVRVFPHWSKGRVNDVRAYLRRAVVNEVRTRGRRRVLEERPFRRLWPSSVDAAEDRSIERHRMLDVLARLPVNQRAVLALRFYEDLSEAETAEALGLRVGTVKSQTSRALARLRDLMNEEEAP